MMMIMTGAKVNCIISKYFKINNRIYFNISIQLLSGIGPVVENVPLTAAYP